MKDETTDSHDFVHQEAERVWTSFREQKLQSIDIIALCALLLVNVADDCDTTNDEAVEALAGMVKMCESRKN